MEPLCAVCNKTAPHRCAACLSVSYCSVEHQKEHWKVHRKNCTNFRIVDEGKLGKGMRATRDLKPGTLVLEEEPIVVSPYWKTIPGHEELILACLTCGLEQKQEETLRKCSKCKWPVCSVGCEEAPRHFENECQIFRSREYSYPSSLHRHGLNELTSGIRVCLLKLRDPDKYRQVLELSSEFSLPGEEESDLVENTLMDLLDHVENLDLNQEEIAKVRRISHINSYTSLGPDEDRCAYKPTTQRKGYTQKLFMKANRFNHSCTPNCHFELATVGSKIRVCTATAVKKGEPLTITYWPQNSFNGTRERQDFIRSRGQFICECPRCLDPTELGTYMSGITCTVCSDTGGSYSGYYLPVDSLDLSDSSPWKCSSCCDVKESAAILPTVKDIARTINQMYLSYGGDPNDDTLIEFCKSVVSENSGKVLHPNHWVIQRAMKYAVHYLERKRLDTMSLDWRRYNIKSVNHILSIQKLVYPGLNAMQASLHSNIACTFFEVFSSTEHEQGNLEQLKKDFEECLVHLEEPLAFYKTGIPSIPDYVSFAASTERYIPFVLNKIKSLRRD